MANTLKRRELLELGAIFAGLLCFLDTASSQEVDESFGSLVEAIQADPSGNDNARKVADFAREDQDAACDNIVVNSIPECIVSAARRPKNLKPSTLSISMRAIDLIIACEVTSQLHYQRALQRPIWPKLQSGITIGIGYDLGQVDSDTFANEWEQFLHPYVLDTLSSVVGLQGLGARDALTQVQDVTVRWEAAYNQFIKVTLPLFTAETQEFCKNLPELSADCRGALVSLVINRGSALTLKNDELDRRKEMRDIKQLSDERRYAEVPEKILEMRRLWQGSPDARGLLLRRQAEAKLFELGLTSK